MATFVFGFITGYGLMMVWKGSSADKELGKAVVFFGALMTVLSLV